MEVVGIVVTGLGEGAHYVRKYNKHFLEKFGFEAFPGTLNLSVENPVEVNDGIVIKPGEEGLFPVECTRAVINSRVKGALVKPRKTRHGKYIIEIIAPNNLREEFSLKDGNEVKVEI